MTIERADCIKYDELKKIEKLCEQLKSPLEAQPSNNDVNQSLIALYLSDFSFDNNIVATIYDTKSDDKSMMAIINFPRKTVMLKHYFTKSSYWKNRYLCLLACLFKGFQVSINGEFIKIEILIKTLLEQVNFEDIESQYSNRLLTDFLIIKNPFAPKNPFQT